MQGFFLFALLATGVVPQPIVAPHASHVTIVVMENRAYDSIVDSAKAPYINQVLIPQGVLLTNSHAVEHPSQPNYLDLFSGSNQDVTDDSCPHAFATRNIASELLASGRTFAGYAESLPHPGYTGCSLFFIYARKHSPWVNFSTVPAANNLPYHGFPSAPTSLVWITPNMCHDMHDCSTSTGDRWLRNNLPQIIAWNAKHDGLLILTWDEAEPDRDGTNHIATILVGPMIKPGRSSQAVTHFTLLRTLETIFALPCVARECGAGEITGIWL